jgi:hypothetical protein
VPNFLTAVDGVVIQMLAFELMRDDLKSQGYSKEDEYFYKKDQEALAKLRAQAEAQRAKLESEHKKQEFWMKCPKCGSSLKEENYGGVLVDRCTSKACAGIFLDGGELEILLKAKTSLLQRVFGR